jgi:signal-transduction protein with cAMP-binding, CBS, and nucleotidyltransferase domain
MEQIKHNPSLGAHFEARIVKEIIKPAKSILNKVSVKVALDEMQARAMDSSPVIDQRGELLGTVSKNKMNREVGGFGHDPKTEPVEAHMEKKDPYCFEDQTIAEAEQIMFEAKVGKVPVVTRKKLLVGTIDMEAIAEEKRGRKSPLGASEKSAPRSITIRFAPQS